MSDAAALSTRVLILAPAGRDGRLAASVLRASAIDATICADMGSFCDELARGAAAGVLTQEALTRDGRAALRTALASQPLWADFPLVVLASRPPTHDASARLTQAMTELGNVTLLDRPLHPEAMVSTIKAALRARARQYEARELLVQLEAGVRERDHFLATLSHELRNPLGAIRNAMHLLKRAAPPTPPVERPLAIVDRQVVHLARLIDDLLDVSRVTTGKVVLQRRTVDMREVLQQTVQQMESTFETQGVKVHAALGARAIWVNADAVRLDQIFTNLLGNAAKYTPSGGRVEVSAGVEGGEAWVRVADTGVGIAPEMLSGIFDLFAQADRSLERSQGGMGIGLTLVRTLLSLHGGTVAVSSAGLGRGSEFVVRLPARHPSVPPRPLEPEAPRPSSAPRPHILVVEDNDDNREMLKALLEQDGFRVDVAADGAQAVAQALSLKPAIAIVDIGLPVLDGFEVARRVRAALGSSIALVALTGYGQPEDRQRTAEAGFDAHLTKPVAPSELEAVVFQLRP